MLSDCLILKIFKNCLILNSTRTRRHRFKLVKSRARLDIRKYFFSNRVIDYWNKLPEHVVEANSVNMFKNRLDKFENYM